MVTGCPKAPTSAMLSADRASRNARGASLIGKRVPDQPIGGERKTQSAGVEVVPLDQAVARYRAAVDMKNELDPNLP